MGYILKTTTLNCNGLLNETNRNNIFRRLLILKVDIVFLQEIHLSNTDTFRRWADSIGYISFFSPGSNNNSCGVAILIRKSVDFKKQLFYNDLEGRLVLIDCLIKNNPTRLVCIYAPNVGPEKKEFFKHIPDILTSCDRPIISGGDYNCIESLLLDKSTLSNCQSQSH